MSPICMMLQVRGLVSVGREQSPRRSLWVRATRETRYYLVTCPPRGLDGHWDAAAKRMRRCGHDLCQYCQLGWERRQFWYVGLLDCDGNICVAELREAQADLRRALLTSGWDCVGTQLAVFKDGPAHNSPVRMTQTGYQRIEPNDIAALVSTLGLPPLLSEPVEEKPRKEPEGVRHAHAQEEGEPGGRRRPDWGRFRGSM